MVFPQRAFSRPILLACLALLLGYPGSLHAADGEDATADLAADRAAARALFEANLDAIRNRDRDAYLGCYLESERLVRNGPGGVNLGFAGLRRVPGRGGRISSTLKICAWLRCGRGWSSGATATGCATARTR